MDRKSIGRYAFLIGLILAIVVGLVPADGVTEWLTWIMVVLALVGGWIHIQPKDEGNFILLTIGLALFFGSVFDLPSIGEFLTDVLEEITGFMGIAVVAIVVRNIVGWFRS